MRLSNKGIDLLKQLEGVRSEAYLDTVGIPTIGVGHTGPDIKLGLKWTDEQINTALAKDLTRFEEAVKTGVGTVKQHEFDGLVIFAFNVGVKAFNNSTLRKRVEARDSLKAIVEAWLMWTKQPELTRRRLAEIARYTNLI